MRAATNYNGVTIDLRLLTGGDEKFVKAATDEKTENCEVGIQSGAVEFAATLRLEISAPATLTYDARTLTTDYALQITLTESTLPLVADPLMIVVPEPQPRVVAANASAGVTILTVSTSGGTNPTFADAENDNLKASGGGDTALVSLTENAPLAVCFGQLDAVFAIDGERRRRIGDGDDSIYFRAAGDRQQRDTFEDFLCGGGGGCEHGGVGGRRFGPCHLAF